MDSTKIRVTYCFRDNKLRVYLPSYKLPAEEWAALTAAGFRWAPKQGLMFAAWKPEAEDAATAHLGEGDVIEDEDITPEERAEERALRFGEYSDHAQDRSSAAYQQSHKLAEMVPFGQPILVGHHSEGMARAHYKKIERAMDKAVSEGSRAAYWSRRARACGRNLENRDRPDVVTRRIKDLEAKKRSIEKYLDERSQRWAAHYAARLEYERAILEASEGLVTDRKPLEVGGAILYWDGWREILKVNKVSVTVPTDYSWTNTVTFDKIKEVKSKEEWQARKKA